MGGSAPAAALSSFTSALDRRLARVTEPPAPLPLPVRVLVRLVAALTVAVPVTAVLAARPALRKPARVDVRSASSAQPPHRVALRWCFPAPMIGPIAGPMTGGSP